MMSTVSNLEHDFEELCLRNPTNICMRHVVLKERTLHTAVVTLSYQPVNNQLLN